MTALKTTHTIFQGDTCPHCDSDQMPVRTGLMRARRCQNCGLIEELETSKPDPPATHKVVLEASQDGIGWIRCKVAGKFHHCPLCEVGVLTDASEMCPNCRAAVRVRM